MRASSEDIFRLFLSRPAQLVYVVIGTLVFAYCADQIVNGGYIYARLAKPEEVAKVPGGPEWRDLTQVLIVMLGLPIALMIWHWRDRNVHGQLENQRKDTNLREFQDVMLRALGGGAADLTDDNRTSLQIAALHQLRGYLRGEFGLSFRRPAFELYCALLARPLLDEAFPPGSLSLPLRGEPLPHLIFQTVRLIVAEEKAVFLQSGFPMTSRSFREVDFSGTELNGISFRGTDFAFSKLNGCRIRHCDLSMASFRSTDFQQSEIINSDFSKSTFDRTQISAAAFDYCVFDGSRLADCEMEDVSFRRCGMSRAIFDDPYPMDTRFIEMRTENLPVRQRRKRARALSKAKSSKPPSRVPS